MSLGLDQIGFVFFQNLCKSWFLVLMLLPFGTAVVSPDDLRAEEVPSRWGTLEGQIVVDGRIPTLPPRAAAETLCPANDVPDDSLVVDRETGGLRYVAVYLRKRPTHIHPELVQSAPNAVDQVIRDCRFVPHMLCLQTHQRLHISSLDPTAHSIRYAAFANVLPGALPGESSEFVLPEPERLPVRASCDFHQYMCGWWIVTDHPYAAVTDAEGRFRIRNLPVGEHEFTIWHERTGYLEKTLKIEIRPEGITNLPPRHYPMSLFVEEPTEPAGASK
ncbi:MAG: carboxypeptidase regulatory-like domain-containing protein [Planctomycetaceae bacterium]|nr:carboxypeptidase regulatory-like domain-containing protein [Planctomycetaceae bacterium]